MENISGLYFNKKDIRWQVVLREIFYSLIGNNGSIVKYFRHNVFKLETLQTTYNLNYNELSIYEKYLFDNTNIKCDICNTQLKEKLFYHYGECGDLCNKCYNKKIKTEILEKNRLYKLMLNEGKKIMFHRELICVKHYLDHTKIIELSLEKKYDILKKINNVLLKTIKDVKNNCGICLNPLNGKLYAGGCGHCFHKDCLDLWHKQECPTCRTPTEFVILYL